MNAHYSDILSWSQGFEFSWNHDIIVWFLNCDLWLNLVWWLWYCFLVLLSLLSLLLAIGSLLDDINFLLSPCFAFCVKFSVQVSVSHFLLYFGDFLPLVFCIQFCFLCLIISDLFQLSSHLLPWLLLSCVCMYCLSLLLCFVVFFLQYVLPEDS